MRRRVGTALLFLAGVAWAAPALPAQHNAPTAPARVALAIGGIHQQGPAHPGQLVGLEVEVRNTGQTECSACEVRVIGGGVMASKAVPRIPPRGSAKVTVGGLVFARPGKYPLTIGIDGPRDHVDFGGKKPSMTFELTVLEGGPVKRGAAR